MRYAKVPFIVGFSLLCALGVRHCYVIAPSSECDPLGNLHLSVNRVVSQYLSMNPTLNQRIFGAALERAQSLQRVLSCSSESSVNSMALCPSTKLIQSPSISSSQLCSALSGKTMLLVGSHSTYSLHTLLLSTLAPPEHPPTPPCPGPEFCTWHRLCSPSPSSSNSQSTPQRYHRLPSKHDLLTTHASILRFSLSSALFAHPDSAHSRYTAPYVDPHTGIREHATYWMHHARTAHVILLNRGPVPAPAWSYFETSSKSPNLSFIDDLNEKFLASDNAPQTRGLDQCATTLTARIITAALQTTLETYLPALLDTLKVFRAEDVLRRKTVVWHGSAYRYVNGTLTFRAFDSDPWTLYYNAQVRLQTHLLHILLPHFNIPFIPDTANKDRGGVGVHSENETRREDADEMFLSLRLTTCGYHHSYLRHPVRALSL